MLGSMIICSDLQAFSLNIWKQFWLWMTEDTFAKGMSEQRLGITCLEHSPAYSGSLQSVITPPAPWDPLTPLKLPPDARVTITKKKANDKKKFMFDCQN